MLWVYGILNYSLLKYFYNRHSFKFLNTYFKNPDKAKYYGWYLMYHTLNCIQTFIAYYHNLNNTVHPYVISLYEHEKGIYLYDTVKCILSKDWLYTVHHLITLLLIYISDYYGIQWRGIHLMYIMNATQPFHYLARILRHINTTYYIQYGDTVFLMAFGYFRIWKYTRLIYDHFDIYFSLRILGILMYILQWVWFFYLSKLYINNYVIKHKSSVFLSISILSRILKTFTWKIQRPFRKISMI